MPISYEMTILCIILVDFPAFCFTIRLVKEAATRVLSPRSGDLDNSSVMFIDPCSEKLAASFCVCIPALLVSAQVRKDFIGEF